MASADSTNLWDALGGDSRMRKVVNDLVDLALHHSAVNYTRDGRYPTNEAILQRTKDNAFLFLSQALGGPHKYSGRTLKEIHGSMHISDREFNGFAECFVAALRRHEVSEELIETLSKAVGATRSSIVTG